VTGRARTAGRDWGVFGLLDAAINGLIVLLYTIIIVAMFAQVVFRYVLGAPLSWSEEISRYMFIWLCYLGCYVAIVRNAHVGVDYLTRHLSRAVLVPLNLALTVMTVVALAFVTYQAVLLTQDNVRAEWGTIPFLSMALAYAAIPAGASLMLLAFLRVVGRLLSGQLPEGGPASAGADL